MAKAQAVKIGTETLLSSAFQEKILSVVEALEGMPGDKELEATLCRMVREALVGLSQTAQLTALNAIPAQDGGLLHIPIGALVRVTNSPVDAHEGGPVLGSVGSVLAHDRESGMLLVTYNTSDFPGRERDPGLRNWYSLQSRVTPL